MIVWLVASAGAIDRWSGTFEEAGLDVVDLIVHRVARPPEPERITTALRARGHDLAFLTSANAVAFVDPGEAAGWSAACVGRHTAEAATAVGFDVMYVGDAGAEALAQGLIEAAPGIERVLFLRGTSARGEGPDLLRAAGVLVDEVVSYAMVPEPGFARAAFQAPDPDVVVVGSPRAAEALIDERGDVLGVRFVAIGPTTGRHLEAIGVRPVTTARSSGAADLVAAVKEGAGS